ncbi:SMC family ATPase [Candidatus Woesearchaeota archaeon]|nr:SMC family ATPase [Candidatus Woesearchaeota archaeon]
MIFKEMTLKNIRSYLDETITFPKGPVLLAGDIGSGKSSLLLAAEFALFGASRTDLPAESLLRKGTAHGSVSLTFELSGKTITVSRHLKKEKEVIKQTAGEIIINSIKKELTPVEMKAEMLTLLGYPEDLLTKNKNYVFRYTVYTPQEEMRFILMEDAETRLSVLRKVFNIDKYHLIRENTALYLKALRVLLAELKARTEPLTQYQQKQTLFRDEEQQLTAALAGIEQTAGEVKLHLQGLQEKVLALEQKYQQTQKIRQQLAALNALLKENENQIQQITEKRAQTLRALSQINLAEDLEALTITAEIQILEQKRQHGLETKTSLRQRVAFVQKLIGQLQQELAAAEQEKAIVEEKQKQSDRLVQEVSQKRELLERKKQVEELFEKTQALITQNQTLLSQSREMQERVLLLNTCPTCLQEVTTRHKHTIAEQETQKIQQAEIILGELQKKRAILWQQREDALRKIEDVLQKENVLTKISVELEHSARKLELTIQKKEELQAYVRENNLLMAEWEEIEKNSESNQTELLIAEKQQHLQQLVRREYLRKQEQDCQTTLEGTRMRKEQIVRELTELEAARADEENVLPELETENKNLAVVRKKERDISVQAAEVRTKKELIIVQIQEMEEQIKKLTTEREKLVRVQEIHHWLETFFINLTHTIEKHVMIRVHRSFDQLFREWFAMMIDDEQVSGRIDDTFTPIIEQNGHEILFSHLSGGERTSAALAYRLALNRVINDVIHSIRTKDVLILDEPTDGFSTEQLDKMRDVLERLGLEQIILVSHESKIESFVENVIRVVKEGHVSRVV